MELKTSQKIAIAVAALLLLAAAVLTLLLPRLRGGDTVVVNEPPATSTGDRTGLPTTPPTGSSGATGQVTPPVQTDTQPPVAVAPPDERNDARRFAMIFAERYGSFSNAADFSNLSDLESSMTAAFAAKTRSYVEIQRAKGSDATAFYGITSRAMNVVFGLFDADAGVARVTVTVQRSESGGTAAGSVYYQDFEIVMKRIDEVWKADSVVWGAKRSL